MTASKILKRQMILELLALFFMIGVIIFAYTSIKKSNSMLIGSQDGMVTVLDDKKIAALEPLSDGEGYETNGYTYTVTNNNESPYTYEVIIIPSNHNEKVLQQIRVGIDNIETYDLTDLERKNAGYVVATKTLGAGYTKIHNIKVWYKLNTPDDIKNQKVDFEFKLIKK